jgi:hypothetical protein
MGKNKIYLTIKYKKKEAYGLPFYNTTSFDFFVLANQRKTWL